MLMLMATMAAAQAIAAPPLDGRRIQAGETCYTMHRPDKDGSSKPFGTTRQRIRLLEDSRGPLIEITTRQRSIDPAGFDMEDVYVVRRSDLRPLSYRNSVKGSTKIELTYGDKQVSGRREIDGKMVEVSQPLDKQVWDGALVGALISALPLQRGATYRVPIYKYREGLSDRIFSVTGEQTVQTPSGPQSAWVVELPIDETRRVRYFMSKRSHRELGYDAGFVSQTLGGSCPS